MALLESLGEEVLLVELESLGEVVLLVELESLGEVVLVVELESLGEVVLVGEFGRGVVVGRVGEVVLVVELESLGEEMLVVELESVKWFCWICGWCCLGVVMVRCSCGLPKAVSAPVQVDLFSLYYPPQSGCFSVGFLPLPVSVTSAPV